MGLTVIMRRKKGGGGGGGVDRAERRDIRYWLDGLLVENKRVVKKSRV